MATSLSTCLRVNGARLEHFWQAARLAGSRRWKSSLVMRQQIGTAPAVLRRGQARTPLADGAARTGPAAARRVQKLETELAM